MKRRYRRNARPNENEIPTVKIVRRRNPKRRTGLPDLQGVYETVSRLENSWRGRQYRIAGWQGDRILLAAIDDPTAGPGPGRKRGWLVPQTELWKVNPRRGRKGKRGRRASGSPGSAAARLAWWRWHHNPLGGVRGRRRNPGGLDPGAARELELFIVNDGDLYRQNIQPVIKNLAKKMAKGTYNHDLAVKLWNYTAGFGAQKYTREHGGSGNGSYGLFSPATRKRVAGALANYYLEEVQEASNTKSNPRHRRTTMARRRKHSRNTLPQTVTFRKGGRHTVVFRHRKATASTRAMRRAAGRRLAKMWTRAERLANLKKARAALRRKRR